MSENKHIAAIDLGSNSFHLVVAKVVNGDVQIVSRHKQRVRLASGLDSQSNLSSASIQRGLDCLAQFAQRLEGLEIDDVRIAATHTLRVANNAHIFLSRAATILPYPIEIISGTEEARLIYSGVTHTQIEARNKLVVDIGGGSTEITIGKKLTPIILSSKAMGCVSYTHKFFDNGKITRKAIKHAMLAVSQNLDSTKSKYMKTGWDVALCSSGTAKAIRDVLMGLGYEDGIITQSRLDELIELLVEFKTIETIKLSKLSEDRQPVFVAGVVILLAIMREFEIEEMHFSSGALREGILYEMDDQLHRSDIRMRTAESLAARHAVEVDHAKTVKETAMSLLQQGLETVSIKKKKELTQLLGWSALLHEVGLSIHHQATINTQPTCSGIPTCQVSTMNSNCCYQFLPDSTASR